MNARTSRSIALAGAIALMAGTALPTLAQPGGGDTPTATLSLAVWDPAGRQSEPAALDLVALAPEISGGSIVISEPVFDAVDAAELVSSGQIDLAILATREWSPLGITSLDVFEAPFLIDDDALALAIATSDVAEQSMAGLEALGVTGLALWPEDLRHLFAFATSGRTFTAPEDFADSTVVVVAGKPGVDLIKTLGGRPYEDGVENDTQTGDRVLDAESGVLDGMVTGLWGAGLPPLPVTVAGDVVLFSKYQMLVANRDALGRLSGEQRAAFDEIVSRVHAAALERHFSEAELAAAICEHAGTVIEAGESARADLRAAARPVTDALAADPITGDLIAQVEDLAARTPRSAGPGTCAPPDAATRDQTVEALAVAEAVSEGYAGSEPVPDGTYRAEMIAAELEAAGASRNYASINAGTWTLTIDGDGWTASHKHERCSGKHEVVGENVRLTTVVSEGCGMDYDVRWRLDGGELSLRLADLAWTDDPALFSEEQTFIDRVWSRVEG